jgi:hypothetical protein
LLPKLGSSIVCPIAPIQIIKSDGRSRVFLIKGSLR